MAETDPTVSPNETNPIASPDKTPPIVSLAEIAETLAHLPGPDEAAREAARAREQRLTKPPGALGRLEELAEWLAAWQGRHPPRMERARVAVFAGNHGVARRGVSAWPASVTAEMVQNFIAGGAAVNAICGALDAELRVYELSLEVPTADFTTAPAMTDEECARAVAYGMMAVEPGIDALANRRDGHCQHDLGRRHCPCAARGPGGGLDRARHGVFRGRGSKPRSKRCGSAPPGTATAHRWRCCAASAASRPRPCSVRWWPRGWAACRCCSTAYSAAAAAAVLHALDPSGLDHCQAGHLSAEPAHGRLLAIWDKTPLLDLGMRLGEGSGAALALALLKAAAACHADMATFEGAGVSGPEIRPAGR